MENIINIPTSEKKFFRQYLELVNPFIKLNGRELDVLAELLYSNYTMKDVPEEHRWKIILGKDSKVAIRKTLNISEPSINNNFSNLRKKKIIFNGRIAKQFIVEPNKETCKVIFNFKFKDATNSN